MHGRHAGSLARRGHLDTTRQGPLDAILPIQDLKSPGRQAIRATVHVSNVAKKVIEMSVVRRFRRFRRFRRAVSVVAVLNLGVSAPIAVNAQVEGAAERRLAVQEQNPVLAPAVPSWDETSGYGAVEASCAEMNALLSGERISGQEQAIASARASATLSHATSGYAAVEASRAANALPDVPAASGRMRSRPLSRPARR